MGCMVSQLASKFAFFPPSPPTYQLKTRDDGKLTVVSTASPIPHPDDNSLDVLLVDTKHGNKIVAFYLKNPYARLTLLYSHGNAADLGQLYDLFVQLKVNLRVNLMGYDYSGYGASTGKPSESSTYADIEAIYECLETEYGVGQEDVILYGQSVGSGPTLHLAAKLPRLRGVVLHSGILSGLRVLCHVKFSFCFDIYKNINKIKKVKCPVLVIHGTEDDVVNWLHGNRLWKMASESYEPLWIKGGGHCNLELYPDYIRHLCKYIQEMENMTTEKRLKKIRQNLDSQSKSNACSACTCRGEDAEIEHVYVAHEIDLDYEFDAARFFDFNRPETPVEAHQAELWFQNAPNYPPSPFVAKLAVREEFDLGDVNDSRKSRNVDCMSTVDDKGLGPTVPSEIEISDIVNGHTSGNKATGNSLNSNFKPAMLKSSTLMKPTATQLARKNRPAKNVASRYRKLLTQNEMNLSISSGVENQSAKRQKLEGGHLCKVTDVKQQTDFVHKTPMRRVTVEQNSACSKLKLTIPREPDLKTAHRAQRIRPKIEEAEHTTVAAPRFKARPLNRRILDAPSLPLLKRSTPRLPEFQEFHLKTLERAMQHTSATTSSLHCNDSDKGWDKHTSVSALEHRMKDARRPTSMGAPKHDALGFTRIFKAQPLDKILSSKEQAGVVQTNKEETTVPMEFDLHTEQGIQHNPPIELFSKLTLTSEGQPNNGSHFQLPQQSRICRKEKAFTFGAKKIHHGNDGCHSLLSARRSLGIR